jgi:membrane-associated phospholipid phosphatase
MTESKRDLRLLLVGGSGEVGRAVLTLALADRRFLMVALAGASLLAQLAKHLVLRSRPELFAALVSIASRLSFPSTHAVQVTAV